MCDEDIFKLKMTLSSLHSVRVYPSQDNMITTERDCALELIYISSLYLNQLRAAGGILNEGLVGAQPRYFNMALERKFLNKALTFILPAGVKFVYDELNRTFADEKGVIDTLSGYSEQLKILTDFYSDERVFLMRRVFYGNKR